MKNSKLMKSVTKVEAAETAAAKTGETGPSERATSDAKKGGRDPLGLFKLTVVVPRAQAGKFRRMAEERGLSQTDIIQACISLVLTAAESDDNKLREKVEKLRTLLQDTRAARQKWHELVAS